MELAIWLSVTVAPAVATCVIRFGNTRCAQPLSCSRPPAAAPGWAVAGWQAQAGASSQVSVMCSLQPQPSQSSSRLTPRRASVSYGEAIRAWPGRETIALRLLLPPSDHLPPVFGDGPGVVLNQHPAQHVHHRELAQPGDLVVDTAVPEREGEPFSCDRSLPVAARSVIVLQRRDEPRAP